MALINVQYQPGTQKSPQNTEVSAPFFTDTDHVHFPDGRLRTIPPYATAGTVSDYVTLLGGARTVHAHKFTGTNAGSHYMIGTSEKLYTIYNGNLYNITPFSGQRAAVLGTDPMAVSSGDATLTITWESHGLSVGDCVLFTGVTDLGGIDEDVYINNIDFRVDTVPDSDTITVEMGTTASSSDSAGGGSNIVATTMEHAITLGADPVSTTSGSSELTITDGTHGLAVGDRIKLLGLTATNGITANELNAEHIVETVPTASTFTISVASNASGTGTGGGSDGVIIKEIDSGNLDQAAAEGYGVGLYGEGVYGVGGDAVNAQSYPRIWSFADFGDNVVMCPGDYSAGDGQKLYLWDGDLTKAPTILENAPTDCNFVLVVNNHIVALREKTIQIAEIGTTSVWSGITTYTNQIQRAWRLVSGVEYTQQEGIIWTPNFTLRLRYVGGQDIWDVSTLIEECGILAPNAHCIRNNVLFWRSQRDAYAYDGSPPKLVDNVQNGDWITENLNFGQAWKCFAYADPEHNQWWFHFPTGDDDEPNDYVIHNLSYNSFTLGEMARTGAQQNGFLDDRFYMANSTSTSVAGSAYAHFTSGAVTFDWDATTSEAYAFDGEYRGMFDQFFVDSNQSGDITLNLLTREYPQGALTTSSDYTVSSDSTYITTKAAGKLIGLKFSGNVQFALGGWKMNVRRLGRRS